MPQVTLRASFDGQDEAISEYICDWPDCPHPGVHLLGVVAELRLRVLVCAEHVAQSGKGTRTDGQR